MNKKYKILSGLKWVQIDIKNIDIGLYSQINLYNNDLSFDCIGLY